MIISMHTTPHAIPIFRRCFGFKNISKTNLLMCITLPIPTNKSSDSLVFADSCHSLIGFILHSIRGDTIVKYIISH